MINIKLMRILILLLTFITATLARADIASDVLAGTLTLQQIARNALNNLSPAQVVTRMIAAGVNPILAAEAVAQVSPPAAAASIAAAAAFAVPDAAADIAATVARLVPGQAVAIAVAVENRVPSMAPQIAALVAQAVPARAVDIAVAMAEAAPAQAQSVVDAMASAVPEQAANIQLAVAGTAAGNAINSTSPPIPLRIPSITGLGGGGAGSSCDPNGPLIIKDPITGLEIVITRWFGEPLILPVGATLQCGCRIVSAFANTIVWLCPPYR